jgi:hypothetical protein
MTMQARTIEVRRDMFEGEELVYYVRIVAPLALPTQDNP